MSSQIKIENGKILGSVARGKGRGAGNGGVPTRQKRPPPPLLHVSPLPCIPLKRDLGEYELNLQCHDSHKL